MLPATVHTWYSHLWPRRLVSAVRLNRSTKDRVGDQRQEPAQSQFYRAGLSDLCSRRQIAAIVTIIIALGFALRAYRLNFQSLWMDELLTYLNSSDAFTTVLLNSQDVNIPPLYYLIINVL